MTIFNVPNITSGQVYDKLTQANAYLQQWTSVGGVTPSDVQQVEAIKRFEVNFASAYLAADLAGVLITDGFNITTGGIAVARETAMFNQYSKFIEDHLTLMKMWLAALHPWTSVQVPNYAQGYNEYGNPVSYWGTASAVY